MKCYFLALTRQSEVDPIPNCSLLTAYCLLMKDWIALNMTPGVGPRVTARLLEHFGSAEAIFDAPRRELALLRLTPETIESIAKRALHPRAEEEIEKARKLGSDILVLDDGVYPALLRETYDPPVTLYVKGAWAECLERPCIAIVGSRRCSTYGQNAALMLSRELAQRGITIVSGMARGIDAAAHRGALEAGGRTVGVMGTGLDQIYPRDHKKLADDILQNKGALVTQFPLGTPPVSENFPYRNRVISGLSLGVVVIEAAENSGSLITARLAMEQNREVFAVPGNITSRNSFGTNYLIKGAGAKLVQQWQDIASELPAELAAQLLPSPGRKKKKGELVDQLQLTPSNLNEHERTIFKLLTTDTPQQIDTLAETTKLSITQLTSALLTLEMRELIRALPGKCFVRKM
ncbi:MAG TPA: DNA-protecting protein DprA [Blastocatellia bacterium]|nr:DNA-protecting protein DprA [Blastocatellia bacterium]